MVQIVIANNGHKIENANKSFSEQKKLFNKSWKSTCQSGIWYDVLFKGFFIISKLFINFGTTEFQTPSRAKKGRQSSWRNRGRQRGVIRFKHKISGLHLSCNWTKMNYGIAFMYKGSLLSKSFSTLSPFSKKICQISILSIFFRRGRCSRITILSQDSIMIW